MKTHGYRIIALALVLGMCGLPLTAAAADPGAVEHPDTAGLALVDLVFVRPLCLLSTVVGTAVYLVSLPLSSAGGNAEQCYRRLVAEPARFTFQRPMGDLDGIRIAPAGL